MSTPNFQDLPYLAQHLILLMLQNDSPATLLAFRYVSKHCCELVDQIIYRSITLHCVASSTGRNLWKKTKWLCHRLLDPTDNFYIYVHEISIAEWTYSEESSTGHDLFAIGAATLERILTRLRNLQNFNWKSPSRMPKNILLVLHSKWPDARLGIFNHNRHDVESKTYLPMDLGLLLSPQLHFLDYDIVCRNSPDPISEFPLLRQILLRSTNLRILRLGIHPGTATRNSQIEYYNLSEKYDGPFNLQFQPGDVCPPLHELKLSRQYRLDIDHCMTWRECMDWSYLTTLDLGKRCPENFFKTLAGAVPDLKCLRFLLREGNDPEEQCSNMSIVRKFFNAINGLEELYIKNCYPDFFQAVWPRIKRHCATLRVLEVHTPRGYVKWPRWDILDLNTLLESAVRLSILSIDLTLANETFAIGEYNRLIWLTAKISIVTKLVRLRKLCSLTLFIRVPEGIKQANAHIVLRDTSELFHEVIRINRKSRLKTLEVRSIKYMDGWFGHDTEDVITANVARSEATNAAPSHDLGLIGTVEQSEQGLAGS